MFRQEECLEIHCHRIWGTSLGDSTWGKIGTQKWLISEKVHFWVQLCLSYLNWFSISATSDLFPYLHKVIQQIILISLTFLEKDKHNPHYSWIPPFWDKHNKTEGDFSPCVPYNKCHIFIQFFQYIDFAWFLCVCVSVDLVATCQTAMEKVMPIWWLLIEQKYQSLELDGGWNMIKATKTTEQHQRLSNQADLDG